MASGNDRGADLPWGWWLRARGGVLEDDDGGRWHSVRDAFWQGRLKFPDIHFAPEQHELLLRVLTTLASNWASQTEILHDLFAGDGLLRGFYMCWLESVGMLDDRNRPLGERLSDEGRSVMLMLQATREPSWIDLPIASVVDAVRAVGRGPADDLREAALKALEREVARRRHVFARERVGKSHLVTLTGIAVDARMPTRRVIWSQSFAEARTRDDFFAWLAERVHRWDDWGALAYSKGAVALTQRFFTLLIEEGGLSR